MVPEGINGLGLLQAVQHFGYTDTTTTVNFLHLTIQEYLAAYHVASLSPDEELLVLHENFWLFNFHHMFLTYVGLTKGQRQAFKHFLSGGGKYFGTGSNLLSRLFSCKKRESDKICENFLCNFEFCFHLFKCLYEAGDKLWYEQVLRSNHFVDSSGYPILVYVNCRMNYSIIETIGLMLPCQPEWHELNFSTCLSLSKIIEILHKPLVKHAPVVHRIRFSIHYQYQPLSSPCLLMMADIVIACKTTSLSISYKVNHFDWLEKVLTHKCSMLQSLSLEALISPTLARNLFSILKNCEHKKLAELDINNNHIDDSAVPEIVAYLQEDCSLRSLNICSNPITGNGGLQIVQALEFNDTLEKLLFPDFTEQAQAEILNIWSRIDERRTSLVKPSLVVKFSRISIYF